MFGTCALCECPCSILCLAFQPEERIPTPLRRVKRSSFCLCKLTLRFLQLSHFISTPGDKALSRRDQPRPPPLWWGYAAPAKVSAYSHTPGSEGAAPGVRGLCITSYPRTRLLTLFRTHSVTTMGQSAPEQNLLFQEIRTSPRRSSLSVERAGCDCIPFPWLSWVNLLCNLPGRCWGL